MLPDSDNFANFEVKSFGHPDTLADFIAMMISYDFSKYCIDNYGFILNHNVDKVVIGEGLFKSGYGFCKMVKPIVVTPHGRMSNLYGDSKIDLNEIVSNSIHKVVRMFLPHCKIEWVKINFDSITQHTKRKN